MPNSPMREDSALDELDRKRLEYDVAGSIVRLLQPLSCASRKAVRQLVMEAFREPVDPIMKVTNAQS